MRGSISLKLENKMQSDQMLFSAFNSQDVASFLKLFFPAEWQGISARIIESGAEFSREMCSWAPRWSKIPPTVRNGSCELESHLKSCLYRAHDCLHQLWGLPVPGDLHNQDDFYTYKRAQMCGEVAVLVLTEFVLAEYWANLFPGLRPYLDKRNALPMLKGPLAGKSTQQIAARMDGLLHKLARPKWVRDCTVATAFCDDYVPMLEGDRQSIDHNWKLMQEANWKPVGIPNARYDSNLDGLELTMWMIDDFYHLMATDPVVDSALAEFNRNRRSGINLPQGWNEPSELFRKEIQHG